ncbi:MAG: hypothetical protein ACSHXY_03725 [Alphaproteobacteria bacterium]
MIAALPNIAFDPLLPMAAIAGLSALAFIMAALAGLGRMRSFLLRVLAALVLTAALLNPQTVEEDREPLKDEVLILRDASDSIQLGSRSMQMDAAYKALTEKLSEDNTLDVTTAIIPTDVNGTRMTATLIESLGGLPQSRLAGVIALTDGQVHDIPEAPEKLLPSGVPFHSLIIGDPNMRDRRIRAILAPRYGLVGEQAEFVVRVDDPGHEGERAPIEIKLNGEVKARFSAVIGDRVSLPLKIERRGTNTVELSVQSADNELTIKNNLFVAEISGIRDRMRVLLVTGQPHMGGRSWRNLLKSDPAVDLVQFTILTNPGEKRTDGNGRNAPQNELSLIAFPYRQLFEDKLDEFDLVIFDQFTRRRASGSSGRASPILPPYYIQNVAEYVEDGGALLVATGPGFATEDSLYRSPLAAILPAVPTGETANYGFRPKLNDKGRRHPVTAPFFGKDDQSWGQWHRVIESKVVSGDILMNGPGDEPLLVIEKVGDGRVAMVMSDQAWLWARGHDGGGPYNEMFRRLSHWLLGEPDLDAEQLTAQTNGNTLMVERRSLSDEGQNVILQKPDGAAEVVKMEKVEDGLFRGTAEAVEQGAYRLKNGDISTITAIGALNPKEFSDLSPTANVLGPFSQSTGGVTAYVTPGAALPEIRRTKIGALTSSKDSADTSWIGLIAHEDYVIRNSKRAPLAPGLLFFALLLLMIGWAWRKESR